MVRNTNTGVARRMGLRVRLARALKGHSLKALAARAAIARRKLDRFEAGRGELTADELVAVARSLGLPLWFFFEVGSEAAAARCPVCGAPVSDPEPR